MTISAYDISCFYCDSDVNPLFISVVHGIVNSSRVSISFNSSIDKTPLEEFQFALVLQLDEERLKD